MGEIVPNVREKLLDMFYGVYKKDSTAGWCRHLVLLWLSVSKWHVNRFAAQITNIIQMMVQAQKRAALSLASLYVTKPFVYDHFRN